MVNRHCRPSALTQTETFSALPPRPKSFGLPVKDTTSEVQIYSKDGKLLRTVTANFHVNSVAGGPDGSIYLAGDAKVARFDRAGKQVAVIDLPHMREILAGSDDLKKRAEDQIKRQRDSFDKTVAQYKEPSRPWKTRRKPILPISKNGSLRNSGQV